MILTHLLATQQDHLTWPDVFFPPAVLIGIASVIGVILYFTGGRRR